MYNSEVYAKISAVVAALISTLILSGGADAWYYADDFGVLPNLEGSALSNFVGSVGAGFYRPIQSMALELQIEIFGWSTIPIHIVTIFLHLIGGATVYYWSRKISGSDWGGMMGASLFLLSPIAVYPVLGNDTLSQVGATVLGFLGFVLGSDLRHDQSRSKGVLAGSLLTCALFFKETGVVYAPLLVGFVLWRSYKGGKITRTVLSVLRRRKITWLVATLVVGAVIYLLLRIVGTHQAVGASSNYVLSANPIHAARNILMTFGGMAIGGSYVEIFQNLRAGRWLTLAPPVLTSTALMVSVIWGAWKDRRLRIVVATFLLSIFAMGPFLVMKFRPSPLYLYGGLPFFASAVGIGVAAYFERGKVRLKVTVGVIIALFFLLHASGSRSLVDLMVANGDHAKAWFDCVNKVAKESEPGTSIAVFLRGKDGGPLTASSEDRIARGAVRYANKRYEELEIYEVEEKNVKSKIVDYRECGIDNEIP